MDVNSKQMRKTTIEKEMMALANCKKLLLMGKQKTTMKKYTSLKKLKECTTKNKKA